MTKLISNLVVSSVIVVALIGMGEEPAIAYVTEPTGRFICIMVFVAVCGFHGILDMFKK